MEEKFKSSMRDPSLGVLLLTGTCCLHSSHCPVLGQPGLSNWVCQVSKCQLTPGHGEMTSKGVIQVKTPDLPA